MCDSARLSPQNKTGGRWPRFRSKWFAAVLAAFAEELQHEDEEVDEVEIEPEGAHHRLLGANLLGIAGKIHLLDVLRVIGGEAGEDQHADDRDRPVQGR